jgi:hypothetical protein
MIGDQTLTYRRYTQMAVEMARVASSHGEYELAHALWRFEQQLHARLTMARIEQADEMVKGVRPPVEEELEDYRAHDLLSEFDYRRLMRVARSRRFADAGRFTTRGGKD